MEKENNKIFSKNNKYIWFALIAILLGLTIILASEFLSKKPYLNQEENKECGCYIMDKCVV